MNRSPLSVSSIGFFHHAPGNRPHTLRPPAETQIHGWFGETLAYRINYLQFLLPCTVIVDARPALIIDLQRAFSRNVRCIPLPETTPACPSTCRHAEPGNSCLLLDRGT